MSQSDGRVLYVRGAEAMAGVGLIVFDRSNNSNKLGIVQQQQRPFNGLWSGATRVGRYQKKQ